MFTIPIIQMGARVYLPTVGRFLQTDPVEGGTLNPYVYAHDPVNLEDYSGATLFPIMIGVGGQQRKVDYSDYGTPPSSSSRNNSSWCFFGLCMGKASGWEKWAGIAFAAGAGGGAAASSTIVRTAVGSAARYIGGVLCGVFCDKSVEKMTQPVNKAREMVSSQGYNMTKYYFEKLTANGRADFGLRATNIINNATNVAPDPKGYSGFYRYVYDGWELIYNPEINEISHLAPVKK